MPRRLHLASRLLVAIAVASLMLAAPTASFAQRWQGSSRYSQRDEYEGQDEFEAGEEPEEELEANASEEFAAELADAEPSSAPTGGQDPATDQEAAPVTEQEEVEPGEATESLLPEPDSPSDAAPEEVTSPIVVVPPLPKIWSGNIEFGLDGTEGNQETFNVRIGGKATAKYLWSTQTYEAMFLEKTAANVSTARNAIGDARWEIPLWSPVWSYYAHGRLEYDEFKPFDLRVAADTGLGYDWIKTDLNYFQTRSGLSTSREFGGVDDYWKPELAFGVEWRYTFDARQKITLKSDYFPKWDDFSDYRLNTQADWEFAVNPAWNLSLKLSAISRYDSTPNGALPHDLNYAATLLWNY